MRDILFRGKLKADNGSNEKGDWVTGDYVRLIDGKHTIHCIYGKGEVDADTVEQYTSLTDKNGTKIFNGDILQNKTGQFCVFWNKRFGNWGLINEKGAECYNLATLVYDTKRPLKVVGNIHDNPEWLKGGAE